MGRRPNNPQLGAAVISLVGTRGPMSRSAIARQLRVSPATITNLTRGLIEQGALAECGTVPSAGGRPAILLDVRQRRRYALGVKITPNHLTMAEVDLLGQLAPATTVDLDMRAPDALDRIIDAVAGRAEPRTGTLLGVGLAIPGSIDPRNPDLVTSPVLGWRAVNLGGLLRDRVGLAVTIDNDVNALAVAERLYGGPAPDNALLVTIGFGIGAAVLVDGRVYHGGRGGAGEIGHMSVQGDGPRCACGLRGCLETLIGDDALVDQARRLRLLGKAEGKGRLNQLAEEGDEGARELFALAGRRLGVAVANIVHMLDPELITISGEGVDMWHHWEEGFITSLRAQLPLHRRDLPVATHPWSEATWAHGAASLVFARPFTRAYSADLNDTVSLPG